MPAKEIEGIVLKELESVTGSPHRLLELISDAPCDPDEMNGIVRAAAAFSEQPRRHEAMIRAVTKVVLGKEGMTIFACRRTMRETVGLEREACTEGQAEVTITIDLTRTRGVVRFKVAGAEDDSTREAPTLISAVVKSREWLDRILRGEVSSQRTWQHRKAMTNDMSAGFCPWRSYLLRSHGKQPEHWSLDTLLGKVPMDWGEQRSLLGSG